MAFKILKPPHRLQEEDDNLFRVFLAGSIEMGKAEDWQAVITGVLADENTTVYNPRRDDWDSSWEQRMRNPEFCGQVDWELDHLDEADIILMYFDPNTISPITLMELGLYAPTGKVIVCCPDGYFRKGNVEVVCSRYDIPLLHTFDEFIKHVEGMKLVDM